MHTLAKTLITLCCLATPSAILALGLGGSQQKNTQDLGQALDSDTRTTIQTSELQTLEAFEETKKDVEGTIQKVTLSNNPCIDVPMPQRTDTYYGDGQAHTNQAHSYNFNFIRSQSENNCETEVEPSNNFNPESLEPEVLTATFEEVKPLSAYTLTYYYHGGQSGYCSRYIGNNHRLINNFLCSSSSGLDIWVDIDQTVRGDRRPSESILATKNCAIQQDPPNGNPFHFCVNKPYIPSFQSNSMTSGYKCAYNEIIADGFNEWGWTGKKYACISLP